MMDNKIAHSLANELVKSAKSDRSYFKRLVKDHDQKTINKAIIEAHGRIQNDDHALEKLMSFSRHINIEFAKNDLPDAIKSVLDDRLKTIDKWVNEINKAIASKQSPKRYNRFIFNSTASLVKSVQKLNIENKGEVLKSLLSIIEEHYRNEHHQTKNIISNALGKITSELGTLDALASIERGSKSEKQATGLSLKIEIELLQERINAIYEQHYDKTENSIKSIYKAHLRNACLNLKNKIMDIENLTTRYHYLSQSKNAIKKHFSSYPVEFMMIVGESADLLQDPKATLYRKLEYGTKLANRNSTEKSITHLSLRYDDAKKIFDDIESEMINQMEASRYQSWTKLALCIALLTGRRLFEVCVTGDFTVLSAHTMKMSGLAKQKNEYDAQNREIEFKVYANANLINKAINTLRNLKDFNGMDYTTFNKLTSMVRRSLVPDGDSKKKPLIESSAITIKLLPKTLRQIYAAMLRYETESAEPHKADGFYDQQIAKHLGHDAETDISTVQSYKDIVIY